MHVADRAGYECMGFVLTEGVECVERERVAECIYRWLYVV
jgi:hypothetical protein